MNTSFLPFIAETLTEAAKIAHIYHGKVTSTVKPEDNNQVLTQADIEIGKFIVGQIQTHFGSHNVIDEEAGVIDNQSDITWVVDPIDGTSNFAVGLPTYGIMVGVLLNDTPIAGGIMLPAFQEVYLGEKEGRATLNGEPVAVSSQQKLLSSLIAYGIDGHQEKPELTLQESALLGKIILEVRNIRTTNSAYDMAQVVAGKYGAFLNQTTKIWDNVALQPIIEAAGGVVTDFWGQPLKYKDPLNQTSQNFTICAGAPQLHKQLQAIIHST